MIEDSAPPSKWSNMFSDVIIVELKRNLSRQHLYSKYFADRLKSSNEHLIKNLSSDSAGILFWFMNLEQPQWEDNYITCNMTHDRTVVRE